MDTAIMEFLQTHRNLTYFIIMFSVFAETGFVITPFFPGDSIVFAAGAFSAQEIIQGDIMLVGIIAAAFAGNMLNYTIGYAAGKTIEKRKNTKGLLSHSNLENAHRFYELRGGLALFLSRFMPLFRTLIPFVAGITKMKLQKFLFWNIAASAAWGCLFFFAGYFFGEIPFVKRYFGAVLAGVALSAVVISIAVYLLKIMKK